MSAITGEYFQGQLNIKMAKSNANAEQEYVVLV